MFGEAFAAELGAEKRHSTASSTSEIRMTTLNPKWTVGEDEPDDGGYEETDDNIIFSRYVFNAVKRSFLSLDVFRRDINRELSAEDEENVNFWKKYKKAAAKTSKLKNYVRQHVPATIRPRMWQDISGGSSFMSRLPNIYQETCLKLFGKDNRLPANVTSCTLASDDFFMSYYLTPEGVISLRRVLFVLSHFHPDITYCPILQEVAAIFLHFMEEVWCFACLSSMLSGKKMYFDQTHAQAEASDMAFQICAKTALKRETKRLHGFVQECTGNSDVNIFQGWLRMMFQYLDFTVIMRLVDCFVVEGPKIFFRTGLFLVRLFYEYLSGFERIGFPTAKDLVIALGQYSEALKIQADDFIKAALRIKIKNRQINAAIEKCLSGEKRGTENDETAISRMISYDVRDISDMIEPKHWEALIAWLPARMQLLKPEVIFNTDIDGFSLKTLYNKTEHEDQTLVILKTDKKEIFGGYLSKPLCDRKDGKKDLNYFGTGETFLFSLEPTLDVFPWTEIVQVDGKSPKLDTRNTSFVVVDIKSTTNRRRRSFKLTKRKVSLKLQGIPKNFSFANDVASTKSYGGIRKNSSMDHFNKYPNDGSDQDSPMGNMRGVPAKLDNSTLSASNLPPVFAEMSPDPHDKDASNNKENQSQSKDPHEHSSPEKQADSTVDDMDADDSQRITRLPDESICLVEKRLQLDDSDGKQPPGHVQHTKKAPNDLFIAGNDRCLIIGGGGGNGIWIDESLDRGRSEVCHTFQNRVLTRSGTGDFRCVRLEMFRFIDPEI